MIENFIEYMWYLLTTPLKKLKKALNKWYILCRVFGKRFDEAKEDILRARDEGMVATCSHEMLPVHGADRRLTRYEGEHPENFRSRISSLMSFLSIHLLEEDTEMSKTTMSKNEIEQKIRDLKTKLSCQESDIGDWKIAKCIEYSTLGMESPYDLQELHKQRQVIRDEIGALEEELAKCEDEDEAASEK